MENLPSATTMMTPGCFMASVDLHHAYYSFPIKPFSESPSKFDGEDIFTSTPALQIDSATALGI